MTRHDLLKRLRETESTTRYGSILFVLFSFFFSISFNPLWTSILQALLTAASSAIYIYTLLALKAASTVWSTSANAQPQILEENSSSQLQEYCYFTDFPLQTKPYRGRLPRLFFVFPAVSRSKNSACQIYTFTF